MNLDRTNSILQFKHSYKSLLHPVKNERAHWRFCFTCLYASDLGNGIYLRRTNASLLISFSSPDSEILLGSLPLGKRWAYYMASDRVGPFSTIFGL